MNTIINRLFQKSNVIDVTSIDSKTPNQKFLQHFYFQGLASKKLDILKEKITNVDFDSDPEKALYQLVKSYLEIEYYFPFSRCWILRK